MDLNFLRSGLGYNKQIDHEREIEAVVLIQELKNKLDKVGGPITFNGRRLVNLYYNSFYSTLLKGKRIDPYICNWQEHMTPIEFKCWQDIRCEGLNMYPQYGVDGLYLDFADPIKKIGIECDGKNWHNKAKDTKRDKVLAKSGWTIYRTTGSECYRTITPNDLSSYLPIELSDEVDVWLNNTSEGLVYAVKLIYYDKYGSEEIYQACKKALLNHTFIEPNIPRHFTFSYEYFETY